MAYVRKTVYFKDKYGPEYGTGTRHYSIWAGMKCRGLGRDSTNNHKYFDRGIRICDEWLSYNNFARWSTENGYKANLTIERIDNEKGYSPDNCRWATTLEQARNKRNVKMYTYNGMTKCIADWAITVGIKRRTIVERMRSYGYSFEQAITTPVGERICH